MKHFVLFFLLFITLDANAQTSVPKVAVLAKLYSAGDTAAVNTYGKSLGYNYPLIGFVDVGNTYMYDHFTFSSKDTSRTKDYFTYTWGEHQPMFGYKLVSIGYGTNSQAIFDTLVGELKTLGATQVEVKGADPGWNLYKYNSMHISTYQNNKGTGHKYTITFGVEGWL